MQSRVGEGQDWRGSGARLTGSIQSRWIQLVIINHGLDNSIMINGNQILGVSNKSRGGVDMLSRYESSSRPFHRVSLDQIGLSIGSSISLERERERIERVIKERRGQLLYFFLFFLSFSFFFLSSLFEHWRKDDRIVRYVCPRS